MNNQPQDASLTAGKGLMILGVGSDRPAKPTRAPLGIRVANLFAILLPFAGLIAAIVLLWGPALGWTHLAIFFVMYLLTGFGITVGYHRLFTHKSFKTGRVMTFLIGVFGSMAFEGPILQWAATHRQHHQHSDHEYDPHSPHAHGKGLRNMFRGFIHAHMGWLIKPQSTDVERYVPDLKNDPLVNFMSRTFLVWALLGMVLPAILGGLLTMSWWGVLLGFIWGGLVRIFFVHHITWSVNSVCHIWGRKRFKSGDESRNNAICGVLALGEGWHNNHHAFPASARHGLRWWEIDFSYLLIRGMALLGLASDVKTPSQEHIERKLA